MSNECQPVQQVAHRVLWEPIGSGHQLVVKLGHMVTPRLDVPDADSPAVETPTASDTDGPVAETPTASVVDDLMAKPPTFASSEDHEASPVPADTPLPGDPATELSKTPNTPAILCMVVRLIPGASWLYPDAKWTRHNKYAPRFQDAKLLCTGGVPQHPCFSQDFDPSIENLNAIMGHLGDGRNRRNTITSSHPGVQVKIRHALFSVCFRFGTAPKNLSDTFLISHTRIQSKQTKAVCASTSVTSGPDFVHL